MIAIKESLLGFGNNVNVSPNCAFDLSSILNLYQKALVSKSRSAVPYL